MRVNQPKVGKSLHCDISEWNMKWVNFVEGSVIACVLLQECVAGCKIPKVSWSLAMTAELRFSYDGIIRNSLEIRQGVQYSKFVEVREKLLDDGFSFGLTTCCGLQLLLGVIVFGCSCCRSC